MDYLDPRKEARHRLVILVGYACIAIAIAMATMVLLYQAYGFGVGKNGTVIQNGLMYVSSRPSSAQIYLNGKLNKASTNTRLLLPSNIYDLKLVRDGYRDWQRNINLQGGYVANFDYPFLFPVDLKTTNVANYTTSPKFATQSPDRRWLLVNTPGSMINFQLNDLKNPNIVTTKFDIPSNILSKASKTESWKVVEWSGDNKHLVLKHIYDNKNEFILIDRENPSESINLNTKLSTNPTELSLRDKKYDQYYIYMAANSQIRTASLKEPKSQPFVSDVLTYRSYGSKTMLYITNANAPKNEVLLKMIEGERTYTLRSFPVDSKYLIDLTEYDGTLYVVAGAANMDRAYVYKDPVKHLNKDPEQALTPVNVLRVNDPNYLSFSATAQFIALQSGKQFSVYDVFNKDIYNYSTKLPLDAPQTNATWMDGNRLTYVSDGKTVVLDYDGNNVQTLMAANPNYLPFFASDYRYVYNMSLPLANKQLNLTQTPLLTEVDL